jgi:hypothetical protein
MYLGNKQNKKPKKTLGQKIGGAVYGLGSKIAQGVLTQVIMKNLPKLLL